MLETAVKASYLYKFAPFIQWPQTAFTTPVEPITICVAGRDPFGPALEEAIRGQRVSSRPVMVRYAENVEPETRCHILFAGEASEQSVQETLRAVAGRPVLVIWISAGAWRGMIQFVVVRGRVASPSMRAPPARPALRSAQAARPRHTGGALMPALMNRLGRGLATPAAGIAVAVALLLASLMLGVHADELSRAEKVREAQVQAQILAGSLAGPLAFDDSDADARISGRARRQPGADRRRRLREPGGRLVASFRRDERDPAGRQPGRPAPCRQWRAGRRRRRSRRRAPRSTRSICGLRRRRGRAGRCAISASPRWCCWPRC